MTDLYALLTRAINSQPERTPEARLAVYNHVRGLYERQRREIDPNLPEAEVQAEQTRLLREQAALETVIARIEAELAEAPPATGEVLSFDRFAEPDGEGDAVNGVAGQAGDQTRKRPRVAARRERRETPTLRRGGAIAAVALVLAGIGGVAWWLRNDALPPDGEAQEIVGAAETEDAQTEGEGNGKIVDRVSGEPPDATPADPPAPVEAPPAQPGAPARPAADASAATEIVAQRAFLFELDDENAAQPKISAGQVLWRLEGRGSRNASLYADVVIAEVGLSFSMLMRRNEDASLPASHTIEIIFVNDPASPDRAVRDVAVPQLRVDKEPRGMPLSGLPIPVADNVFLIGLSNLAADVARNNELLRQRDWVDLPLRFATGKMGTITFAKGSVGQQAITDALDSWR
ncbi:MAG: hypothetical protein ACOYJQ_10230 [Pseudochelatococcus sp.]|jgi:hypothetical protein|uniref:hypothetical protein n=1 Tax=Pseudochelatococcus sp. TaxID=2020869 RepID=UPI003D930261